MHMQGHVAQRSHTCMHCSSSFSRSLHGLMLADTQVKVVVKGGLDTAAAGLIHEELVDYDAQQHGGFCENLVVFVYVLMK